MGLWGRGVFGSLYAAFGRHKPVAPIEVILGNAAGGGAAGVDGDLRDIAIANTVVQGRWSR